MRSALVYKYKPNLPELRVASRRAMRDVEAATTPLGAPKKRMCLVFGIVIMTWFSVLVYIISGVKAPDRQSYMDNLDFKANNAAIPKP